MSQDINKNIYIITSARLNDIGGPSTVISWLFNNLSAFKNNCFLIELKHQTKIHNCFFINASVKAYNFITSVILLALKVSSGTMMSADALGAGLPSLVISKIKRIDLIVRLGGEPVWERYLEKNIDCKIGLNRFYELGLQRKSKLMYFFVKIVLNNAKKIIVPSTMLKNIIVRYYGVDDNCVSVINNPVIKMNDVAVDEKELTRQFLFVGRLTTVKNVDFLVSSFIKANITGWQLLVAGVGDGEDRLKKIVNGSELKVILLGKLNKAELSRLYKKVDYLLLPSHSDIFPNVVMEAMSNGLPVVISPYTGLTEDVKECCHVFSSITDEQLFINDLRQLVCTDVKRSLLTKLNAFNWQTYHEEVVLKKYIKVLYE